MAMEFLESSAPSHRITGHHRSSTLDTWMDDVIKRRTEVLQVGGDSPDEKDPGADKDSTGDLVTILRNRVTYKKPDQVSRIDTVQFLDMREKITHQLEKMRKDIKKSHILFKRTVANFSKDYGPPDDDLLPKPNVQLLKDVADKETEIGELYMKSKVLKKIDLPQFQSDLGNVGLEEITSWMQNQVDTLSRLRQHKSKGRVVERNSTRSDNTRVSGPLIAGGTPAVLARFLSPMVKTMLSENRPTSDKMMPHLHNDFWNVAKFSVWAAEHEVSQKVKDTMKETWPKAKETEGQESLAANKNGAA